MRQSSKHQPSPIGDPQETHESRNIWTCTHYSSPTDKLPTKQQPLPPTKQYTDTMELFKKLVGRRNMVANEDSCRRIKQTSCGYRPPALVTSTAFDCDETFSKVAQALLLRYEHEGMSEREAINATLETSEEKRAFLEALDLRHATL